MSDDYDYVVDQWKQVTNLTNRLKQEDHDDVQQASEMAFDYKQLEGCVRII